MHKPFQFPELRPHDKGTMNLSGKSLYLPILALCACAGLLMAAFIAAGNLSHDAASGIFASGILLCIAAAAICVVLLLPLPFNAEYRAGACVLLVLALLLRLSLFDHISPDYVSFLSIWTETMRGMSVREALSTPIGDYNMPYLYLILLISRLPFYDLYCIKLFSVLFDIAAALAVLMLCACFTSRPHILLLSLAAALLIPTTWLNSAYWGQCDSIYAAFALWGLWLALKDHPVCSLSCFALSLSFKLQAIFLLPILAFLLITDRIRLRHVPVFPAVFLLTMLPAVLGGRSLHDTFSIYFDQTQSYPYLSLNAPSFWSMISNQYFEELSPAPVLIALTVTLVVFWLLLRRAAQLDAQALVLIALLFSLMIPWLLPRMHERYFYLAEILSIVWAASRSRDLPVALILTGGGFLIYCPYLFGEMPILSNAIVAAVYGLTVVYLFTLCCRRLYGGAASENTKGGISNGKS